MALRCFLFSPDEETSEIIRQAWTGLGLDGESCSQPTTAVEKLANEIFPLVVIDWDQQPEAGMLISAARERKAAERPLVLAIVSDDPSASKALQAGANSILRKPVVPNQVTDTLTTARELLRSRQESADSAAKAAAAGASSGSATVGLAPQPTLRVSEFRPGIPSAGGQIETDSEVAHFPERSAAEQTDPLKDLEPVAAAVQEPPPAPTADAEPKTLEWYLKNRGVARQPGSVLATSTAPSNDAKTELLGYDQTPSSSAHASTDPVSDGRDSRESARLEEKQEAQLFSYITGGKQESTDHSESRFRPGKKAIIAALVLAGCAIVAAPQAPWHAKLVGIPARGRHILHGWLNPQPVTAVTQAPTSHEDFGRAGDEYKLPVAENIPDATTDPSQISVLPVVDPTAKKPATDPSTGQPAGTTAQPVATPDGTAPSPPDGNPTRSVPTPAAEPAPVAAQPVVPSPTSLKPVDVSKPVDASPTPDVSPANAVPPVAPTTSAKPSPVVPHSQPQYTVPSAKVPSSLKSQIATMVPESSGNKAPETALPAIEPVSVPELAERALLIDQPTLAYPANAAGKQGSVVLQVLIGRDGAVQDAKFLQGSLAFARAAIDSVKQWKFKPYVMNGRPVQIETTLILKFAPAQ